MLAPLSPMVVKCSLFPNGTFLWNLHMSLNFSSSHIQLVLSGNGVPVLQKRESASTQNQRR